MHFTQFQRGISLRNVLPQGQFFGDADIRVTSCCSDPNDCQPGDMYVAIDRPELDGHQHVGDALNRGATSILAERLLPVPAPHCVVPDSQKAFGRICQSLAGNPAAQMRTMGITGSHGKTTVSMLLAGIFRAARQRTGVINSLGFDDACDKLPRSENDPTSPELAEWLKRMTSTGCSNCLLEVSSRSLANHQLAGLELDVALLTNIRRNHLDWHGNVLNYRRAKASIFQQLKDGGVAIINADDASSKFVQKHINDRRTITFGLRTAADVMGEVVERHAGEQTFVLTAGNESAAVQTSLFGDYQLSNCLAAAAMALSVGIDLPTIARGLESLHGIAGRMEPIFADQPFSVFVDGGQTPDCVAATLKSLRQVTDGRVICVFGATSDGDPDQRPQLGRVVERHANLGVITNDNPGWEEPLQIAHDVLDGYNRPGTAHVLPNRKRAIEWALGEAGPGDAVLITGKGCRVGQTVKGAEFEFDDRLVAQRWLEEVGSTIEYESPRRHIIPFPGVQCVN